MEMLRAAGATVNQTPLDWEGNARRLGSLIDKAKSLGASILCLPELSTTGYGCEDMFFNLQTAKHAADIVDKLREKTDGLAVLVGLPVIHANTLYNCAAMIQNGKILGINAKKNLPREGVHYENRWFDPWPCGVVEKTTLCGEAVPIGDLYYQFGDIGVGVEICEEAWGAEAAYSQQSDSIDLVLNPSASHFALGKYEVRQRLVLDRSRANRVNYVYTNLLGLEAGRIIYDGGVFIAEPGRLIAAGDRFGFHDGAVTFADLDIEKGRLTKLRSRPVQRRTPNNQGPNNPSQGPEASHQLVKGEPLAASRPLQSENNLSTETLSTNEEFLEAEMLGLFDYLRKSRAKGYTVSLSGGCDSSTVAVLVGHMIASSLKELGPKRFAERLNFVAAPKEDQTSEPKNLIQKMLTCIYQKTKNSSQDTEDAARSVAQEIGAKFINVDVEDLVQTYRKHAEKDLDRTLDWNRDDLSLQNVQARARSPFAWLVANLGCSILLCTSNRSEASVGYATMDGDSSGGLAPLAGIDKHFLRQWLRWAETSCQRGLGPIGSLKLVNNLKPTAELRPLHMTQTDESDLMPYEILSEIERYFVRDKMAPQDIWERLRGQFAQSSGSDLKRFVDRFFALWVANQWKRERFAPSFHLDDESVDPKTWCRFPILCGQFPEVLVPSSKA